MPSISTELERQLPPVERELPPVMLEFHAAVAVLRLNRPAVHNAINVEVMLGLEEALDRLDQRDEVRVVILTGAGERSFCAGADLNEIARRPNRGDGEAMSRRMKGILGRLADGARPVIAAVNGNTLGGGCEVLLACHLRIAVASARFSFRHAAMGVVTGWGGTARAISLLGSGQAVRLLLTAETLNAQEALRVGLVDALVDASDGLMDEAMRLAGSICANAESSVASFLELVRTYEREGREAADRRETELFGQCWVGEHFRRRVSEWKAKARNPP